MGQAMLRSQTTTYFTLFVLLTTTWTSTSATELSVDIRVRALKDIVEAIGAAGDSLKRITDGVGHMAERTVAAYKYIEAERDINRLKDISARATELRYVIQTPVVKGLHDYISGQKRPRPANWEKAKQTIGSTLVDLSLFLEDLKKERSDFVLEDAYQKLTSSVSDRVGLLKKLQSLPEPTSSEEREVLKDLSDRYLELLEAFEATIQEMNNYIKQRKL